MKNYFPEKMSKEEILKKIRKLKEEKESLLILKQTNFKYDVNQEEIDERYQGS